MEAIAEKIHDVSILRRLLFATAFLPSCYPNFWENVAAFATHGKKASLDPDIAQILMENTQMLNNSGFSQDKLLMRAVVLIRVSHA